MTEPMAPCVPTASVQIRRMSRLPRARSGSGEGATGGDGEGGSCASTGTNSGAETATLSTLRRRMLGVLMRLTLCYLLCWAPTVAMESFKQLDPKGFLAWGQDMAQIGTVGIVFNAVLNPHIYGMYDGLRSGL